MGVAALIAVLQKHGPGVEVPSRQLAEEACVTPSKVAALLHHAMKMGDVVRGGTPQRATFALSGQPKPEGRRMLCARCRQWTAQKGFRLVDGVGRCCAACLPQLPPQTAGIGTFPTRGERSPEGRPKAESKEPWYSHKVERKPSEPAQPVEAVELPGVKVTVRATPLGRYEVPGNVPVIGGFASLGIGRYLPEGERA